MKQKDDEFYTLGKEKFFSRELHRRNNLKTCVSKMKREHAFSLFSHDVWVPTCIILFTKI